MRTYSVPCFGGHIIITITVITAIVLYWCAIIITVWRDDIRPIDRVVYMNAQRKK